MNILRVVVIVFMAILVPIYGLASDSHLRISFIEGEVQMKPVEAGDWGLATMNAPASEGDQFWVPQNGKLEIQANTGTYIRLDQESSLQILSLDKNSLQLYISKGHAYIIKEAPEGAVTQVDTLDASTRVFVNAIFRVDLMDKYTEIAVYKDYVETENKTGSIRVNAGELVTLGLESKGEIAPMGKQDDWEKWNKTRNDMLLTETKEETPGNLPAELKIYSSDLNSNGKWVETPEYGQVWTPSVGEQWSPYRDGRWISRGNDYIWVADEPWGWAPYHYGRWAFIAGMGWGWVPPGAGESHWSPGYVGWVTSGDYVAWVPLAPGEIYYGRGDYGENSVNIINTNVDQVQVVYKNIQVNNGVTVIHRNTFATASPKIVEMNRNIIRQELFVSKNMSIGAPAIKPTKASYFASNKIVPETKLPPQAIRNVQIRNLEQSRPFIQEQGKSVLNQGMRPMKLPVNTIAEPRTPGEKRLAPLPPNGRHIGQGGSPAPDGRQQGMPPAKPGWPQAGPPPQGMPPAMPPRPEWGPAPGAKAQECQKGQHFDNKLRNCVPDNMGMAPAPPPRPQASPAPGGRQPMPPPPPRPVREPAPSVKAQECQKGQHFDNKLRNCVPDDKGNKR